MSHQPLVNVRLVAAACTAACSLGATTLLAPPAAQASASRHYPKVHLLGWTVDTFDHNQVGGGPIPVAAHGTYTASCGDPIVGVDLDVRITRFPKKAKITVEATFNGARQSKGTVHGNRSGTTTALYDAGTDADTFNANGTYKFTFTDGHKKLATSYISVVHAAC